MTRNDRSARWWEPSGDRVVCRLCPRECRLAPGQRGFCYVRANHDGALVLDTYGRSSGFALDPIEKKPLNHFLPGTSVYSFGTAGCNLGCKFCQNHEISTSRQWDTISHRASPEEIAQVAKRAGAHSVAMTYNDPIIFAEYAIDVAAACREAGLYTVAVTAGYIAAVAHEEFFAAFDAVNIDLKAFTPEFYRKVTGGHLATVLETLNYLASQRSRLWFEITTLLIPGLNDSAAEVRRMCEWIVENLGVDVPHHFSAFHPDHRMRDIPRTPFATLRRARQIARETGELFPYTGNVHDPAGGTTYCPGCQRAVVVRDWYQIREFNLIDGCCAFCSTAVPGVYSPRVSSSQA